MTSARPVLSAAMKKKFGEEFRSLSVDMESAGVAMAAGEAGLSFFIMRAVCDPFTQSIPPWLFDSLKADGSVRFSKLFGELARRPAAMVDLFRMQLRFHAACSALATGWNLVCASGLLSQLSVTEPRP